jgi:hypothetical protein
VEAQARNGDLILTLSSPKSVWTTEEAIEIVATLRYVGDQDQLDLRGGGGPIQFSLWQLEGGDAVLGGGQSEPCRQYPVGPHSPLVFPFAKFGVVDDEPPFDRAFFDEPRLLLPPGRWEARAWLQYGIGECDDLNLEVTIEIDVVERGPSPVPTDEPLPSDNDPPNVRGVLEGDANLEGGCVWLRDAANNRWEILWPDGYSSEFSGDLPVGGNVPVIVRDGEVIARNGDLVTVSGHRPPGAGSHCMVGTVYQANEVVRVTPQLAGEIDCGVQPENVCDDVVSALAAGVESEGEAIQDVVLVPYKCRLDAADPVDCPPVLNAELAVGAVITLVDGTEWRYNCFRPTGSDTFECVWIDSPPIIN